jgi:hypothetical protein
MSRSSRSRCLVDGRNGFLLESDKTPRRRQEQAIPIFLVRWLGCDHAIAILIFAKTPFASLVRW